MKPVYLPPDGYAGSKELIPCRGEIGGMVRLRERGRDVVHPEAVRA